jgi:tetratricopeptide (TPR) repeat protein
MKIRFQYIVLMWVAFAAVAPSVQAQPDRREVRQGNRRFRKENWREADVDYRRALLKDSTSFAANYNLANTLYRQGAYDEAGKSLERLKEAAGASVHAADYYNSGDVALQKKDYAAAVEAFKQALLRRPDDLDAKENYIYAKKMLENQQNQDQNQDQNQQQNQDQNRDQQNQDQNQGQQNQDQNQDQQNQDQNQDQQQQQPQPQEQQISPQQARQMLQAIQAKEKETQDKVNKEKAAVLKSRQKDKNW